MALTIATGFVVDDAIVVLENISRHLESGMSRRDAVLLGAREVSFTVLSITLSLIAVFLPILLMGGIPGRLFREFTVTLSLGNTDIACHFTDNGADDVRALSARILRGPRRREAL